jgi:3'-5' exoribonuclease
VAALAEVLPNAYGIDGLPHDTELVCAASLLHDVGKVYTLPPVAGGTPPLDAASCDHVTRGALLVHTTGRAIPTLRAERLEALLHAILAHHGRREWGAPVEPHTVETWLVHLADLAEARLWGWSREEADHGRGLELRNETLTEDASQPGRRG